MTSVTMVNHAMTGTTASQQLNSVPIDYFPGRALTAAAKAGRRAMPVIAALKRCATQRLGHVSLIVVAISLCVLCPPASAQAQNQTLAQTRQELLRDLDSGQFRDAVLVGQQAVSRWPRDAQLRHYLGVAYFKGGDLKSA
jgi:hypothetical protein